MNLSDAAGRDQELLKENPLNKWHASTAQGGKAAADQVPEGDADDDEEAGKPGGGEDASSSTGLPELPNEHIPVIVTTYGRICVAAKSYQIDILYLLHAYDHYPTTS